MPIKPSERTQFMGRTYSQWSGQEERWYKFHAETPLLSGTHPDRLPWSVDLLRCHADEVVGKPCQYCGEKLKWDTYAIDHAWPIGRAVEFAAACKAVPQDVFRWENIDLRVCKSCNKEKGQMTRQEYLRFWEFKRTLPRAVATKMRVALIVGASFQFGRQRKEKSERGKTKNAQG